MKVVFLARWYPHKYDPMFGLFVQRHAEAVALYDDVTVIYVHPDENAQNKYDIERANENGADTIRIYYKKQDKISSAWRYFQACRKGLKLAGKPDLIHVHVLTRMGLVAYLQKKLHGTPYMITEPDGPYASFGGDTNAIGPATMDNTMDAVSLGDGGSALVTFERPIRNGEGPDFAVFENSFNDTFLELAFVEVSSDGEHFVRFPATSLTPTDEQVSGAVGGVDATMLNNLAGKFRIGYGTPFDLEELAGSENLDIDSIVYVRIIDVIGTIDPQYATYDAYGPHLHQP